MANYSINRNRGTIKGWKEVTAAVIFNHNSHELLLRQDWDEDKTCAMDFPKFRTFFIQKEMDEGEYSGTA